MFPRTEIAYVAPLQEANVPRAKESTVPVDCAGQSKSFDWRARHERKQARAIVHVAGQLILGGGREAHDTSPLKMRSRRIKDKWGKQATVEL